MKNIFYNKLNKNYYHLLAKILFCGCFLLLLVLRLLFDMLSFSKNKKTDDLR